MLLTVGLVICWKWVLNLFGAIGGDYAGHVELPNLAWRAYRYLQLLITYIASENIATPLVLSLNIDSRNFRMTRYCLFPFGNSSFRRRETPVFAAAQINVSVNQPHGQRTQSNTVGA
jgi:hypothetical protein